jgi:hypothetical protein
MKKPTLEQLQSDFARVVQELTEIKSAIAQREEERAPYLKLQKNFNWRRADLNPLLYVDCRGLEKIRERLRQQGFVGPGEEIRNAYRHDYWIRDKTWGFKDFCDASFEAIENLLNDFAAPARELFRRERELEAEWRRLFPKMPVRISPDGLYGYLRVSSPPQVAGGSFDRQADSIRNYIQKKGFKGELSLFADVASAFTGAYLQANFGQFLRMVKEGKISNADLFVEAEDRFSRMGVEITEQIIEDLRSGGVVLHFTGEEEFDKEMWEAFEKHRRAIYDLVSGLNRA